jgi:hypothetical protein
MRQGLREPSCRHWVVGRWPRSIKVSQLAAASALGQANRCATTQAAGYSTGSLLSHFFSVSSYPTQTSLNAANERPPALCVLFDLNIPMNLNHSLMALTQMKIANSAWAFISTDNPPSATTSKMSEGKAKGQGG